MMKIKSYQKIDLKSPVTFLAAWPGIGNVGIRAVDYIRQKLKLEPFAEVEASEFIAPESVVVNKGLVKLPPIPKNIFYYRKSPNLIIFEGEVQLKDKPNAILMEQILNFAKDLGVKTIYTAAAFPVPMKLESPSNVYGAATTKGMQDFLTTECKLKLLEMGEIAGSNGILVGYAEQFNIPAASLLATIPVYAVGFPNPQASKAIVKVLEQVLKVKISYTELDLQIRELAKDLFEIRRHIKEQFYESNQEREELHSMDTDNDIPNNVKKKIEQLFYEAKCDRKKAYMLKEELDKWNLFELYEDRFLDLFKTK